MRGCDRRKSSGVVRLGVVAVAMTLVTSIGGAADAFTFALRPLYVCPCVYDDYSDVVRGAYSRGRDITRGDASTKVAPMMEEPAKVVVVVVSSLDGSSLDGSGSKGWPLSLGRSRH